MGRDEIIDEVLVSGLNDWVMLARVEMIVRRAGPEATLDDVIAGSVAIIDSMTDNGLVEVGDVREQTGFEPWGIPPAEAAARIRSEWQGLGRDLEMGEICWLSNTALGDRRAERLSDSQ